MKAALNARQAGAATCISRLKRLLEDGKKCDPVIFIDKDGGHALPRHVGCQKTPGNFMREGMVI